MLKLIDADGVDGEAELAGRTDASIREPIATGVPFDRIAETIRLANELVIRALLGVAIAREASAATLTTITLAVTNSVNEMLDTMANRYLSERQRFSSSGTHAQQEMIDMLITGRPVDSRLANSVLKTSIDDYHLGLVVSGTASSPLDLHTLRRSVDVIRDHLQVSTVVVRENPDSVWMWATSPRPVRVDAGALATAIDEAVRIGVGSTQRQAAGFAEHIWRQPPPTTLGASGRSGWSPTASTRCPSFSVWIRRRRDGS